MADKEKKSKTSRSRRKVATGDSERLDAIIDAAMELAVEKSWTDITLADIAARAGISLAELRRHVSGRDEILRLFTRRVDEKVLSSLEQDPLEGDATDRLFELIMRRLEALAPWRPAIRDILKESPILVGEHPPLACQYLASQRWMLAAAGLERPGLEGAACAAALGGIYLRALKVWVEDDDPGFSRTMSRLDQDLKRAAQWLERLEGPAEAARSVARAGCAVARGLFRLIRPRRDGRKDRHDEDSADIVATTVDHPGEAGQQA